MLTLMVQVMMLLVRLMTSCTGVISDIQETWHDATDNIDFDEVRDVLVPPPQTSLGNNMRCKHSQQISS